MFLVGLYVWRVLYVIVFANLSARVLGAGRQLAKFMELQSLNDLGYPKRYIRTLQVLISSFPSCYFFVYEVLRSPYSVSLRVTDI